MVFLTRKLSIESRLKVILVLLLLICLTAILLALSKQQPVLLILVSIISIFVLLGYKSIYQSLLLTLQKSLSDIQNLVHYQTPIEESEETQSKDFGHIASLLNRLSNDLKTSHEHLRLQNNILNDTMDDINEQNQKLQKSQKELIRSNQELEQFAYITSHDLQTPLKKIHLFSDLLEEAVETSNTGEAKSYLNKIHLSINQMQNLIKDILDISRVNSQTLSLKEVDLKYIFIEIVNDFDFSLNEINASLQIDKMPTLTCDFSQMKQLFANIIGNAIKYRSPDRKLKINILYNYIDNNEYSHEIIIEDNGLGFDNKFADEIFGTFKRLHNNIAGTGIGLSICKKIVERHKGKIYVESQEGVGTSFHIKLKQHVEEEEKNQSEEVNIEDFINLQNCLPLIKTLIQNLDLKDENRNVGLSKISREVAKIQNTAIISSQIFIFSIIVVKVLENYTLAELQTQKMAAVIKHCFCDFSLKKTSEIDFEEIANIIRCEYEKPISERLPS